MSAPPPSAGGGGAPPMGMPGLGGAGMPDMATLMRYLSIATQKAPAFIVGFIITLIYLRMFVGLKSFRETVSPVAGFYMVVFAIAKELIEPCRMGLAKRRARKLEEMDRRRFNDDMQMGYRQKLD